jgi:hypothetical protein
MMALRSFALCAMMVTGMAGGPACVKDVATVAEYIAGAAASIASAVGDCPSNETACSAVPAF